MAGTTLLELQGQVHANSMLLALLLQETCANNRDVGHEIRKRTKAALDSAEERGALTHEALQSAREHLEILLRGL